VHEVVDVRQKKIDMAEPVVPEPSFFDIDIAVAELKKYESPGIDQVVAKLIQAEGETLWEIHKPINSVCNKKELPEHLDRAYYCTSVEEG
jgi:hypothetical protein